MRHWAPCSQTLFMFCHAADCPSFGAIVPCHFISDNISSTLLLLKGGGGRDFFPAVRAWWFIGPGCRAAAPHFSNLLFEQGQQKNRSVIAWACSSGAPNVCVCANFHGFAAHTFIWMSRRAASTANPTPDAPANQQHAHTCKTTQRAWWKERFRTLCLGMYKVRD